MRKRRLNQGIFGLFLSRSTGRHAGHNRKTGVIVSKKSRINQHFLRIPFFMYFFGGKYEFCAYLACIHFRE